MVNNHFPEPEIDPLADTNPSLTIPPVKLPTQEPVAGWRRFAGLLSLLAAAGFTIATVLILLSPPGTPETPPVQPTELVNIPTNTPEQIPPTDIPVTPISDSVEEVEAIPTASDDLIGSMLSAPLVSMSPSGGTTRLVGNPLRPFTTIPDRARSEVIEYEAVRGDTIYSIAQRFGLQPESIAWANPRRFVQALYPGDRLNILPADGVLHTAIANQTIGEIASKYRVDPYTVIDSEFNQFPDATPDTIVPSGVRVVVPGGEAEEITWQVAVEVEQGTGYVLSFAYGQANSCGQVSPSGGSSWSNPLPGGTFMQGFSAFHTGVDIAAATGTVIRAANSGPVLYSGWNTWGYGNTVALGHGPYTTLYGHMRDVAVYCGQYVNAGDVIGYVGSTGRSSGPHLHFEIRYQDTPTDPTSTIPF